MRQEKQNHPLDLAENKKKTRNNSKQKDD